MFFSSACFIGKRITQLIPNCWSSVGHFQLSLGNNQAWKTWPIKFQRHQGVLCAGAQEQRGVWAVSGCSVDCLAVRGQRGMAGGQVWWGTTVCAHRQAQTMHMHDFKRNILKTRKGILVLGLIVPLTGRDAKNSFLLPWWSVSVSQMLDKVVAVVVIRQKMIPTSKPDLHLNRQYC